MTKHIYTVSSLVGEVRGMLEDTFAEIWVEGEISNLAQPPSGHQYFSLKEGDAVIRCVLFAQRRAALDPADGMKALLRGRVSVYPARGDLQMIVSYLEDAGEGALRREFELLKRKLAAEGLFDEQHKKSLPEYPNNIGVISSASGAVLHDIRVTLNRRYPLARVLIYPTAVQGDAAVEGVVEMLRVANERREVDLLIVARGGGSLEDLHAFNTEPVARAIFASDLPVVSAIGHEVDYTIADWVADLRAPTPTAAAETVAPDIRQLKMKVANASAALQTAMRRALETQTQNLDHTAARLLHPMRRIESAQQNYFALMNTLTLLARNRLDRTQLHLQNEIAELRLHSPHVRVMNRMRTLLSLRRRLITAAESNLTASTRHNEHLQNKLQLMNPEKTLQRGYAILQDERRRVVMDADKTKRGQTLSARVARGRLSVVVEKTEK